MRLIVNIYRMLYSFLSGFVSAKTASSDVPPDILGNGISCSAAVVQLNGCCLHPAA